MKINLIIGMRQPIKYFKVGSSNYPYFAVLKSSNYCGCFYGLWDLLNSLEQLTKTSPTFHLPTSTRGIPDACFHLKLKHSLFRALRQKQEEY